MKKREQIHIAIIGAGLGGIATAVALKKQLGHGNFTIYERAGEIGGTWRDNTYPGCGCDVPSHWYSLSSELNPNWSKQFSPQPEILDYWKAIVTKWNLRPHIQFNTEVRECRWDASSSAYNLLLKTASSPDLVSAKAHVLVSAIGGFLDPKYPTDVPGVDVFKGDVWHSARWNHKVDLTNKRIGVVGSGCSAAQFVPKIATEEGASVVNFIRTPNWLVPQFQADISNTMKWIFKHFPLTMKLYRALILARSDMTYIALFPLPRKWLRKVTMKRLSAYMKSKSPKKYHDQLIPTYPPGCKRMIIDPGFLECLHRDNVDLNFDGVDQITEDGIVTKKGDKIDLDVIIFGTGFDMLASTIQAYGADGRSMMECWDASGGPSAYMGTTVPNFPNFFMLLGPNVATGHASVIFSEEAQIHYIVQFIRPIIEGKVKAFEVTEAASTTFNDRLQKKLANTVWVTCTSWYRQGMTGKVFATWPGTVTQYWWNLLVPIWDDYKVTRSTSSERWNPSGYAVSLLKALIW